MHQHPQLLSHDHVSRHMTRVLIAGEQPLLRLSAGLWRLQLARARVLRGVRRAERGVGAAGAPASPAVSSSGDTEARGPAGGIARGPFSLLELDSKDVKIEGHDDLVNQHDEMQNTHVQVLARRGPKVAARARTCRL